MKKLRVVSSSQLVFEGKLYACAVGKAGFALADDKREGDLKTPAGTYALRELWYRADKVPEPVCALTKRVITPADGWCDDAAHEEYNRHIVLDARGEGSVDIPPPACGGRLGGGLFSSRHPRTLERAKELRKTLTDAEQLLWMLLRRKQLGFRFRRQYAIGKYIADFACLEKRLVVELDGGQHTESRPYDEQRDRFIQKAGFQVLRFWNHDVFNQTQVILESIWETLNAPTPTLPRKQGRGCVPPPVHGGRVGGGQFSFEHLHRDDDVYDLIVPLGYNDNPPVAGRGSAIFLHVAKPDYAGTEGCVALAKEDLLEILAQVGQGSVMEIAPV